MTLWRQREKTPSISQGERLQKAPTLLTPWSQPLYSPELWEDEFLSFKPLRLWYFVVVVRENYMLSISWKEWIKTDTSGEERRVVCQTGMFLNGLYKKYLKSLYASLECIHLHLGWWLEVYVLKKNKRDMVIDMWPWSHVKVVVNIKTKWSIM